MATVVADADVTVLADTSKLAGDLRKKLEPILKKITAVINTAADVDQFEKDIDKAIKTAEKKTATIKVEVDVKTVDKEVDRTRNRINRSKPATIRAVVDFDESESGFLGKFANLGRESGNRFVQFLGDSLSTGLQGLSGLSNTAAQGLIGIATAGATVAVSLPAAAGAVVALSSAIAAMLPLVIGLAAPVGALALVAGTLFIGLRDVQEALEGDEEALKRLTPSARGVLNVFGEFKPVLKEIRDAAQEALFEGLSGPLRDLGNSALPIVKEALVELAETINGVLLEAIAFFNSEEGNQLLVDFFDDISESAKDIASVAPDAIVAVTKLVSLGARLGRAVLPQIIDKLEELIGRLEDAADSGQLEKSFQDALRVARQIIEAIKIIFNITKSVGGAFLEGFAALIPGDEDQGKMDKFINTLKDLQTFLEDPVTQEAIRGIGTAIFLLVAAVGIAIIVLGNFIAVLTDLPDKGQEAFNKLSEAIDTLFNSIVDFTNKAREKWRESGRDLGGMLANATNLLNEFPGKVASALSGLTDVVQTAFNNAMNAAQQAILDGRDKAVGALNNIKTAIIGALFSLPSLLYNSGQAMIQSLAQGILSQLGKARSAAGAIVSGIKGFFYNSPPKEGPMAGNGGVDRSAEIMLDAFTKGMLGEIPGVANATERVVQAVAEAMGIGPTGRFVPPTFGTAATVTAPTLKSSAPLGLTSGGSSGRTTTVNNARTTSATINIIAPTDDPNAIADRLVRRLLEARA